MDNKTSFSPSMIKTLSWSFAPIIIYIIADTFFGTRIGLIIALSFGALEFLYTYIKSRKIEKFILFDILLLCGFGGVSILLENDIFFKFKPAILEFILVVILGISAFTSTPILSKMMGRYLKDLKLSKEKEYLIKKMSLVMFVVFLIHTIAIVYTALYCDKKVWAFVSTILFYIIAIAIAVLPAGFMLIKRKIANYKYSKEEWFDIVNEDGNVLGKAPRSICHGDPKLMHPVVHIHVFNSKKELCLQKRSLNKSIQPGKWDTAVGGHIASGEALEVALLRELKEELGISNVKPEFLYKYVMTNNIESELIFTFILFYEGKFIIQKEELDEAKFWTFDDIKANLNKKVFTPNFEDEFEMLVAKVDLDKFVALKNRT